MHEPENLSFTSKRIQLILPRHATELFYGHGLSPPSLIYLGEGTVAQKLALLELVFRDFVHFVQPFTIHVHWLTRSSRFLVQLLIKRLNAPPQQRYFRFQFTNLEPLLRVHTVLGHTQLFTLPFTCRDGLALFRRPSNLYFAVAGVLEICDNDI